MPSSADEYLSFVDSNVDRAGRASGKEDESLFLAAAQVQAIAAIAAALDRLAAAIEATR